MPEPRSLFPGLLVIAAVVAGATGAFAYTAGWLAPGRLTPAKVVDAMAPPGTAVPGHRRNHAKGTCFVGNLEASGDLATVSRAAIFARGAYPVVGRFNISGPNPAAPDSTGRVRGLSVQVRGPGGSEWRSGNITAPLFPVATPAAFYDLTVASGSKDPGAMPAFVAAHPEFGPFGKWATTAPWTASYAQDRFNGLNAFRATAPDGTVSAVRWSFIPTTAPEATTPDDLAKRGPNALDDELRARIASGPVRFDLVFTVANPGDPTADPSQPWPDGRRTIKAGTLVVERLEAEPDGPCRDLNYDPTVLPDGLATGDDPFPAARSSAYAVSYDRRTAEAGQYPRTPATPR